MKDLIRSLAFGAAKLRDTIEKFGESADRLARESEAYAIKTRVMLDQDWFNQFRISVGGAMRVARARAEIKEELDADPRLKEIYLNTSVGGDDYKVREPHPEPEWFRAPEPVALNFLPANPDLAELHCQAFVLAKERHIAYVEDIRHEIRSRSALRQPIIDALSNCGLKRLFEEHLSDS